MINFEPVRITYEKSSIEFSNLNDMKKNALTTL